MRFYSYNFEDHITHSPTIWLIFLRRRSLPPRRGTLADGRRFARPTPPCRLQRARRGAFGRPCTGTTPRLPFASRPHSGRLCVVFRVRCVRRRCCCRRIVLHRGRRLSPRWPTGGRRRFGRRGSGAHLADVRGEEVARVLAINEAVLNAVSQHRLHNGRDVLGGIPRLHGYDLQQLGQRGRLANLGQRTGHHLAIHTHYLAIVHRSD